VSNILSTAKRKKEDVTRSPVVSERKKARGKKEKGPPTARPPQKEPPYADRGPKLVTKEKREKKSVCFSHRGKKRGL